MCVCAHTGVHVALHVSDLVSAGAVHNLLSSLTVVFLYISKASDSDTGGLQCNSCD